MPCITLKTNAAVSPQQEQQLKAGFAEIISLIPRKREKWLMCEIESGCHLWLSGTDAPAAIAEIKLFGKITPAVFADVTQETTRFLAKQLSIAPERIYCTCIETPYWGWNGVPL